MENRAPCAIDLGWEMPGSEPIVATLQAGDQIELDYTTLAGASAAIDDDNFFPMHASMVSEVCHVL